MCCIHCPKPTPEEAEDEAFSEATEILRRQRNNEAIRKAIAAARPVTVTTIGFQTYHPRFQAPTVPSPDRPRGL